MDQLTRYANRDARLRKVEEDKAKILLAPLLAEKDAQIAVLQEKLKAGGDPELLAKREEELKNAVERVKQLEAENNELKKALEEATKPAPEAANAEAPAEEVPAPAADAPNADATAPKAPAEQVATATEKPQAKKKGK